MAKRKAAETGAADGQEAGGPSPCHPRFTEKLFGHAAAEELFLSAFNAGSLHHAWLVTGERGIGKATFAYRAARFLLSRDHDAAAEPRTSLDAPASHPAARQIAAGAHPSLFVLPADAGTAASIGVDEVRKLRAFLSLTSTGAWRTMIVDPVNDLTISSANALLKAIEEPPPRTVFFLVSHGAAAVIPTIRSRCIKLALRPLGFPDFKSAVSAAAAAGGLDEPEAEDMSRIFALSAGSPGRALDLLSGGFLSLAGKVERIMEGLPRLDQGLVHELIQSSGGKGNAETFTRLCDFIEERVADRAKTEALQNAGPAAGAASWAELWQTARARRLEMEALNLDKGAFLITVFSDMERIARKH